MAVVTRKVRQGRSIAPETLAAREILDKVWKGKREDLPIQDATGKVLETLKVVVVTPTTLGKGAGFTGTQGLVRAWAKDRGHDVRILECDGGEYAITEKVMPNK